MILWFHHHVHGCSRHFCSVDRKFSVFPPLGLTCSIVGFQTQGLESHEEDHAPSHCTCSLPRSTVSRLRYYVNMKMEEVGRETRGWFFLGQLCTFLELFWMDRKWLETHDAEKKTVDFRAPFKRYPGSQWGWHGPKEHLRKEEDPKEGRS